MTMMRWLRFLPLAVAGVLVFALFGMTGPDQRVSAQRGGVVPDQYIVTFKDGVDPTRKANEKAKAYGLELRHVYTSALNGFSAVVPPGQLKKLQSDPDVAAVIEDRKIYAFTDSRPLGIRRSQADRNPISQIGSHTNPISVDVAVIDTGIDPNHPDLNVVGGVNCVPQENSYADQNGHGTHVAGTIGARDNGVGVVGVAPGARLWAVRVLNAAGEGEFSDAICGVDWVTAHADVIEIANMSLGGEADMDRCPGPGLHAAICSSINAGVTYIVASGNSGLDASGFLPAAYPEVITVSALADSDGAPGGKGPTNFFYGADDTLATFSNYGAPVDIAAPGVNINSTFPGGGYIAMSGTSMASPHVAGAAAIYAYLNPNASPSAVKSYLLSIAWPQNSADGFTGDVDAFPEPLLNAGSIGGNPLPPPPPACSLAAPDGVIGSQVQVSCANFGLSELVRVYWDSTATTYKASFTTNMDGGGSARLTIPDATGGQHQIIVRGVSSGLEIALPFSVKPALKLSSTSGKVGGSTFATVSGFAANDTVAITWDGATSPFTTGSTSATGGLSIALTIPDGASGAHTVTATGTLPVSPGGPAASAQATYTVQPGLSLSPSSGKVGTNTTITARGFKSGELITLSWQDTPSTATQITQITAGTTGSASLSWQVPEATSGSHLINAAGSGGSIASIGFSVSPDFAFPLTTGTVGQTATATLTGYAANEAVTLKWYDTSSNIRTLLTVTVSARGSKNFEVAIPESTYGSHRFEAVGTASGSRTRYVWVAPTLSLAPTSGPGGTSIALTATGFGANEAVSFKWYTSTTTSVPAGSATSSATGTVTHVLTVPADATAGGHKVEATGGSSFARTAQTFTVTSSGPPTPVVPTCTASPTSGTVGSLVTVTCANFALNESIRLYWDTTAATWRASIWTGATGGGTVSFTVPDSTAGTHNLIAVGATSGTRVDRSFSVLPSMWLSSSTGKVGGTISTTLKGFGSGESVSLLWDGVAIKSITVGATGGVATSFTVPESTAGAHVVEAVGTASAVRVNSTYTVLPGLTLSPTSGPVGRSVTVSLRGYGAADTVSINWYDGETPRVLSTATTSAAGSASATIVVPAATGGAHVIEGSGASGQSASANFSVTATSVLAPTSGTVGSSFDFTLSGFAANESIDILWFETTSTAAILTTVMASPTGNVVAHFTVPETVSGLHKVLATGDTSGASTYQYFNIKAAISLSVTSGPPGTVVTASLTGYRGGEMVNIAWYTNAFASTPVASGTVSALGSGSIAFTVPADATSGDHKVDAAGQSSFQKSSAIFSVSTDSGGSTGTQSEGPTYDAPVADDFSASEHDGVPAGWVSVGEPVFTHRGNRLEVDSATGASGWLIRDGDLFTNPDLQVRIRATGGGKGAGLVLGWVDAANYIAVLVNADAGRLEVIEVVNGAVRTHYRTAPGALSIERGRDYWLRAEAGTGWLNLYWSTDGSSFASVGTVEALANVTGGVGLFAGSDAPAMTLDDFSAAPGQSGGPNQPSVPIDDIVEAPADEPTAAPEATEEVVPDEAAPTEPPVDTDAPEAGATPVA
jgi:subtilisin